MGHILRARKGAALVEFGIAAPFLAVLVITLIDFGFGFYYALLVEGAAAAGGQYAIRHAWDSDHCPGATCPVTTAVQTATSLGAAITLGTDGTFGGQTPQRICACAGSGSLVPSGGTYNTTTGSCGGSCSAGESPGAYASVAVQFSYTPLLPYPWTVIPITLKGQAYRRLQ